MVTVSQNIDEIRAEAILDPQRMLDRLGAKRYPNDTYKIVLKQFFRKNEDVYTLLTRSDSLETVHTLKGRKSTIVVKLVKGPRGYKLTVKATGQASWAEKLILKKLTETF